MLSLIALSVPFVRQQPPTARPDRITISLPPGPGPTDNPLKGFASYSGKSDRHYGPVSMAFHYVPWRELEPNEDDYRFDAMEAKYWQTDLAIDKPIIFRVFLDYPGRPTGLPNWLIQKGVSMRSYRRNPVGQSPDYDNPDLREHMMKLIAALGHRYDGNPRVAFIQVGFLGHWGEWHTYPQPELFANQETQSMVIDAMRRAFPNKHLMARYGDYQTCRLPWLGFHDDLFPEDTLAGVSWHFLPRMVRGGTDRNWQVAPVGGEMVPRAAEKWLGEGWATTQQAVRDGHFSWVGPYNPAASDSTDPEFIARRLQLIQMLGYQFSWQTISLPQQPRMNRLFKFTVTGSNDGVAPFYYPWKVRFALLDGSNDIRWQWDSYVDIRRWQPGKFAFVTQTVPNLDPGAYRLAVGIIDPWRQTPAIRFANDLPVVDGMTILAPVTIR
jgi:hypothetical protein